MFMHFIIVISVLHGCDPCFQSAFSVRKWRDPAQTFNLTHLEFIKTKHVFPIIETSVKMDTKKSSAMHVLLLRGNNTRKQFTTNFKFSFLVYFIFCWYHCVGFSSTNDTCQWDCFNVNSDLFFIVEIKKKNEDHQLCHLRMQQRNKAH